MPAHTPDPSQPAGASPSVGLGFRMHAERTPNPQSIKWVLSESICEDGTANFREPITTEVSPLAAQLFEVQGVEGVFLGANFVTVTKQEDLDWPDLAQPVVDAIKAFVASGDPALGPAYVRLAPTAEQGEVVARIQALIDSEIRPAVAMDGGDVLFVGFEDGVVQVTLQGSCVGCPSSTATLRFGIEGRLKEAIPEVQGVIQV